METLGGIALAVAVIFVVFILYYGTQIVGKTA